jgi:hypothetical protein
MTGKRLGLFFAGVLFLSAQHALATRTVVTDFGGSQQVWFRADDFDEAEGDVGIVPELIEDGLVFSFEVLDDSLTESPMAIWGASDRFTSHDWWIEYGFPLPRGGEWHVWSRAGQNSPASNSLGSHFIWVLDEFEDEIPDPGVLPALLDERDRLFGDRFRPEDAGIGPGPDLWAWVGNTILEDGEADSRHPVARTFQEGENVLRIYERESGDPSVQFELFVLVDVDETEYVPSDEDALAALELLEAPPGARFVRGDADASGLSDVTDAIVILGLLFLEGGAGAVPCRDAADVDDSGALDITDAVYLLTFLFASGPQPPAPGPACGVDPGGDADGIDCVAPHPACDA